jgi:hypothetical protein
MSPQYSMSRASKGAVEVLCSPPAIAVPDRSQIHQRGNQEPYEVDSRHWQAAIDQPRVHQRGERQEDEAQDQEQDAVEGAVHVMREKPQERYREARERQDHDQE